MSEKKEGELSVKDFVLAQSPPAQAHDKNAMKKKMKMKYEVLLEDGENFVIKRHGRPATFAVFLPSNGNYYIDKDGGDTFLMDEQNLTTFLKDLPAEGLMLQKTSWISKLNKGKQFATKLLKFIEECGEYIKTGYFYFDQCPMSLFINQHFYNFYKVDKKLADYFFAKIMDYYKLTAKEMIAKMGALKGISQDTIFNISGDFRYLKAIKALYGLDNARKYIDAFVKTNQAICMNFFIFNELLIQYYSTELNRVIVTPGRYDSEIPEKICNALMTVNKSHNKPHMEFKAFLEYMTGYKNEGFRDLNQFVRIWSDVLSMQKLVYGKIREKYPRYLLTVHGQMVLKTDIINTVNENSFDFVDYVNDAEYLEWKPDWGPYIWIIPHTAGELADEAQQQQNCLKAYIPQLQDNLRKIVFMRRKKEPDVSDITIEVDNNGQIGEIAGFFNREPNAEEIQSISRWAKEKNLIMPGQNN